MNLLIVEDHPSSRKLLRVQLEAEGHTITEACNGEEALYVLRREPVDGIISDILMPRMDGFRLCYEVRKSALPYSRIPLVLYTSTFVSPSDQDLAQALDADAFIRKPASPAVILAAIREAANPAHRTQASEASLGDTYVLERYNSALVRKLEDRNGELQQSLAQVHRAHEEILELNHMLEARVQQRTTALEAANTELESISRAVARDMLVPLQTVCSNAQRLEQLFATAPDREHRERVTGIVSAARRMSQLVDTLAEFIRIGRTPIDRGPLDLDDLVDEAIASVYAETPEGGIQWERHTLPRISADSSLLRQVLVTLIGNAVRYTRGRNPPIIEIGSRSGRAHEAVIFVRDNGLGYDARGVVEDPENPLGLARAHRIVARHGGRMWSETTVGNGATFFFSLPQENGKNTDH